MEAYAVFLTQMNYWEKTNTSTSHVLTPLQTKVVLIFFSLAILLCI